MPNIYILEPTELYSTSREGYSLIGWDQKQLFWPKEMGRFLGQVGAYNFFHRAGFKLNIVSRSNLNELESDDLLVVDVPLESDRGEINLDELFSLNCRLLLSGNFLRVASFFNVTEAYQILPSSPYNSFGVSIGRSSSPLQPSNWVVYGASKISDNTSGKIFEISGDRLSSSKALRIPKLNSFFKLSNSNRKHETTFLNGHIFSALQSWLQGQEDLTKWISWHRRQHWLDDYVDLLFDGISLNLNNMERLKGISKTTICLRHDNDDSIDANFSKLEHNYNVRGTFAILNDHNLPTWKTIQKEFPEHEYTLHYTTIKPKYSSKLINLFLSYSPFKIILNEYLMGREVLSKGQLSKQVSVAKQLGIATDTLHRHFSYVPYPEIIDEFDGVYKNHSNVLATSSFFRGNFYRWGANELDGETSTNAPWPDSQFPFWMPFKIANAARNGKILPGWENTLLMEAEPNFAKQVLDVQHKNLPYKLVMLSYHPSNTQSSVLSVNGTLSWLEEIIKLGKLRGYTFSRYDDYVKILNKNDEDSKRR